MVTTVWPDSGETLEDESSPQHKALKWLEGNANLDEYEDWKRIQRYVLAVFYFSTNGDDWHINDRWLSDDDECTWYSDWLEPICDNETSVLGLVLGENNLVGTIPHEISGLSESLTTLYIYKSKVSGSIPTELGLLSHLSILWLDYNELTGTIPSELFLPSVTSLSISGNGLSGTIPDFGLSSNLVRLYIDMNAIEGSIPSTIGGLSNLEYFVSNANQLSGNVPSEIGQLSRLEYVYCDENRLSKSIPSEIGLLTNLGTHYGSKSAFL
jgi:Leucine-rich repeat (LRR) protein